MVQRMRARMLRRYVVWDVRRRLLEQVAVPDAAVDAVFKAPGEILDLTVLLASTPEDAEQALARVRAGEDFAAVAKEVSISPGNLAGNVRRQGLERGEGMYPPAVEDAIFATPAGKISAPLETAVGWLVVRVDERRLPAEADVAKLRASVAERLRLEKATAAIAAAAGTGAVKTLRAKYAGKDLPDPEGNPAAVWRALEEVRVAEVDGTLLTLGDLFRDVRDYALLQKKIETAREEFFKAELARQVEQVGLLARGREQGIDKQKQIADAVEGYTRSLLTAQYVADIILGIGEKDLDQDRCRAFFDERKARYFTDERLDLSQILVRREEEARAVMAELAAGGDFAALAKRHSVDRGGAAGGGMGWAREDALGQVFGKEGAAALLQRARDRRVEPVLLRTTSGYHVVVVRNLQEIGEGRFEEVREQVQPDFLTFCQQEAVAKRREALRAAAVVVVDEAKIKEIAAAAPKPESGLTPHGGTGRTTGGPAAGGSPHGAGGSPHGGLGSPKGASPHGPMGGPPGGAPAKP